MNGAPKPPKQPPKTTEPAVVFNSERREKPISSSPKSFLFGFLGGSTVIGFLPAFRGNTKRRFARLLVRLSTALGGRLGDIRRTTINFQIR
jgi:hypothetical protein